MSMNLMFSGHFPPTLFLKALHLENKLQKNPKSPPRKPVHHPPPKATASSIKRTLTKPKTSIRTHVTTSLFGGLTAFSFDDVNDKHKHMLFTVRDASGIFFLPAKVTKNGRQQHTTPSHQWRRDRIEHSNHHLMQE